MPQLELKVLSTPDDRLRFGQALTRHGGGLEMLGRSISTQAILQGAIARIDALFSR